jgi:maltose-binding protein MalE
MPKNYLIHSLIFLLILSCDVFAKDILIWTSNEGAAKAINEIKKDYEAEFKNKVTVEVLNKDLTSLFKTASLAGKGPDILLWANDVSGELAQSGLIEPLDELPFLKENFLPVALKAFMYKGRLYGYPYAVESSVMF